MQTDVKGRVRIVDIVEDPKKLGSCKAEDVDLSKNDKETITWKNNTSKDWTIHFDVESPFDRNDVPVRANGGEYGPVSLKENVATGKYHYDIKSESRSMAADPNVIVR
jgi:hypothetical protein